VPRRARARAPGRQREPGGGPATRTTRPLALLSLSPPPSDVGAERVRRRSCVGLRDTADRRGLYSFEGRDPPGGRGRCGHPTPGGRERVAGRRVPRRSSIESDLMSAARAFQEATFHPVLTDLAEFSSAAARRVLGKDRGIPSPGRFVWRMERGALVGHSDGFSIVTVQGRALERVGGHGSIECDEVVLGHHSKSNFDILERMR
ncbi:hypothetical protein THAOC_31498, partial [Thalassiosira oceanica]